MIKVTWCRNEQWLIEFTDTDGESLSKFASDTNQTRENVLLAAVNLGLTQLNVELEGGDKVGDVQRQSERDRGSESTVPE